MTSGVDVLTLKILLNPLVPGDYKVNAGYVNGMFQTSTASDSNGEFQLGSVFSCKQKFFNTSSGTGGPVTIQSIDGKVLRGNFQENILSWENLHFALSKGISFTLLILRYHIFYLPVIILNRIYSI